MLKQVTIEVEVTSNETCSGWCKFLEWVDGDRTPVCHLGMPSTDEVAEEYHTYEELCTGSGGPQRTRLCRCLVKDHRKEEI